MSFSRVVNNLLRRDPWHHLNHPSLFSLFDHHPFFRPSLPASCAAVFELPIENNRFYRTQRGNQQQQQQQQQEQQSDQNKDATASTSNNNNTEVVSNESQNNSRWLNRRDRHRHHNHPLSRYLNHYHPPLSVFSPFNSLFSGLDGFGRMGVAAPEMAVDMLSSPSAYTINAAVPGVEKKDISITVEDGVLTIKAERKEERKEKYNNNNKSNQPTIQTQSGTSTEASNQGDATATTATTADNTNTTNTTSSTAASTDVDDDLQYDYVESSYGTVQRSFSLPDDVDITGLSARHENGVVKITIPRIAEKKVERQQVQIQ